MDRPIEVDKITSRSGHDSDSATTSPLAQRTPKTSHLMCRTSGWGIIGFLACGYFAWLSFAHVLQRQYDWPHDAWTAATYIVWILVLVGLMLDTRCLREQIFFGTLVTNFVIGFGLTVWRTIPVAHVRTARIGTGALWALAALISLSTMGRSRTTNPVG